MYSERSYYECNKCSYAVSGVFGSPTFERKLDGHEYENPGHKMKKTKDS